MKSVFLTILFLSACILSIGQDLHSSATSVQEIYIEELNTVLEAKDTLDANLFYGFGNRNAMDYSFFCDSLLLIHFIENNTLVLLNSKNNNIISEYCYNKKKNSLEYELVPFSEELTMKTCFFSLNSNMQSMNDSLVFVSALKKKNNLVLFFVKISNNCIIPIYEKVSDYNNPLIDNISAGKWKIRNVLKMGNSIVFTCQGEKLDVQNGSMNDYLLLKNYNSNEIFVRTLPSKITSVMSTMN